MTVSTITDWAADASGVSNSSNGIPSQRRPHYCRYENNS